MSAGCAASRGRNPGGAARVQRRGRLMSPTRRGSWSSTPTEPWSRRPPPASAGSRSSGGSGPGAGGCRSRSRPSSQGAAGRARQRRGFPGLQVRTRGGRWAVLHASGLSTTDGDDIAVIIEEASPGDLAPVLMMAYGLTRRERSVTGMVCRGLSTRGFVDRLQITPNTVQDHLKSIFDKTDTRSRRELVSRILHEQYLPRAESERDVGPSGSFVAYDLPRVGERQPASVEHGLRPTPACVRPWSGPASTKQPCRPLSLRRAATTEPAQPPPTTSTPKITG